MTGRVVVDKQGAVGWLVFDHEARRNAITADMWRAIPGAVAELDDDPAIRVIVMRGAGETAFVSGADISEFAQNRNGTQAQAYDDDNRVAFEALANAQTPLIAMIHGFCVGGGVAIALNADMRYSADDGQFGIPAVRLGLGYQMAGIETLTQVVGYSNAKEIFFRGCRFNADQALQRGLVNEVFPKADLEAKVAAIAAEIAANAPLTIRAGKLAVRELMKSPQTRDEAVVHAAVAACYQSADYAEGVAAFLEKRRPDFQGR